MRQDLHYQRRHLWELQNTISLAFTIQLKHLKRPQGWMEEENKEGHTEDSCEPCTLLICETEDADTG